MRYPIDIHFVLNGSAETCREILRALPEWFGNPYALEAYAIAAEGAPMVVASDGDGVIGFLSAALHFGKNCEIASMGILKSHHRKGIGRGLIAALVQHARQEGYEYVSVKTLSEKRTDAHYAATRAFYHAVGFHPFEELPTLWGKGLPCLLMIKRLDGARD